MTDFLNEPNVPLNPDQAAQLKQVLPQLDGQQLSWLAGYLTARSAGVPAGPAAGSGGKKLTILFGSQTGNSEDLAEAAAEIACAKGFDAKAVSMGDYNPSQLKKEQALLVVISTHGEGDPPDNAEDFHAFVYGKRAPKLNGLPFSVLALGDTSYELFCKTGVDFDEQLEALGGKRIADRVDCDLDYEALAEQWMETAIAQMEEAVGGAGGTVGAAPVHHASASMFDKKNPFLAERLESLCLNGRGSDKETLHVEISLEDSGLHYEPGDSLGVYPSNDPVIIQELLELLGFDPEAPVHVGEDDITLQTALMHRLELTVLTKPLLEKYNETAKPKKLGALLGEDNKEALREYLEGRDMRDLIKDYAPSSLTPQDVPEILRKLPARLYSIASSLEAHPDEVHLTVGVVRYHAHGEDRVGVCSTYFSDRLEEDEKVPVYIDKNKNFKLPANPDTPIIMIGPGTGVAPFRAFVEHREALGATGKNWLFFGDQHFNTDFLYQAEWLNFHKKGVLNNLDVAFSRDQSDKVYVQHRMMEKAAELYTWIQEGAHVYVCGDESKMAHDVHDALIKIAQQEGGLDEEAATQFVKQMQKDKRYQRDVY